MHYKLLQSSKLNKLFVTKYLVTIVSHRYGKVVLVDIFDKIDYLILKNIKIGWTCPFTDAWYIRSMCGLCSRRSLVRESSVVYTMHNKSVNFCYFIY